MGSLIIGRMRAPCGTRAPATPFMTRGGLVECSGIVPKAFIAGPGVPLALGALKFGT